jgi:hypothetical protein
MKTFLFITIIFLVRTSSAQVITNKWDSNELINSEGDTIHFPSPDSISSYSKYYFNSVGQLDQEIRLLNKDSIIDYRFYPTGETKSKYFYRLTILKESNHEFNPLLIQGALIAEGCFKCLEYCKSGILKKESEKNSISYKAFTCGGILYAKADSCDEYFNPSGKYTQYDTLTNKVHIKGVFKQCLRNKYSTCEEGWWDFYENGKLVYRRLYEQGKLIEEN